MGIIVLAYKKKRGVDMRFIKKCNGVTPGFAGVADLEVKESRGEGAKSVSKATKQLGSEASRFLVAKKSAFTLAEVLITLGVIGVVAALTLPTLITNYKNKVYVNQLKATLSTLSTGINKLMIDSGCEGSDLMCTGLFPNEIDETYYDNLDKAVKKAFKGVKSCTNNSKECEYSVNGLNYKFNAGQANSGVTSSSYLSYGSRGMYTYILPNGVIFYIANRKCVQTSYPTISTKLQYRCADVTFDVNGKKSPNIWGRDLFIYTVAQDGTFYPYGGVEFAKFFSGDSWENSSNYYLKGSNTNNCDTEKSSIGYACAARIMNDGWVMKY